MFLRLFATLNSPISLKVALLVLAVTVACAKQPGAGVSGTAPSDEIKQLQTFQMERENYEKQLRSMDVKQLAAILASDSQKGREPFNSAAYREMITRGEGAAVELAPLLTHPDRSSLLGLIALRKLSAKQYKALNPEFRVSVLVGSLANSQFFNTWGVPNLYWEDAARAIVEEGNAAAEPLIRLLRDTRAAPVWGSEEAALNAQYHYRVCDYALALLNEIRNVKTPLPADIKSRDRLIEQVARGKP